MSISGLFLIGAACASVAGVIALWRWIKYTNQIGQLVIACGHLTVCTGLVVMSVHASNFPTTWWSEHGVAAAFLASGYLIVVAGQYINLRRIRALAERRG